MDRHDKEFSQYLIMEFYYFRFVKSNKNFLKQCKKTTEIPRKKLRKLKNNK